MWDNYLATGASFVDFHICVCAALLVLNSDKIQAMKDPQEILLLLQHLDMMRDWDFSDVEVLLSKAREVAIEHKMVTQEWLKVPLPLIKKKTVLSIEEILNMPCSPKEKSTQEE